MKKRKITINEYKNCRGSYTIVINNIRFDKNCFDMIEKMIRHFTNSQDVFWGFYRTDGINLTFEQCEEYQKEILNFFQSYGEIEKLSDYLTVAKTKVNEDVWKIVPFVCDYYLDTILFNSKVDWETFKKYYFEYIIHYNDDYIINDYAEFLFSYFDSGDFSICFDPQKYDPKAVLYTIKKIICY